MPWDVETYRVEYECDDHWELRKSFMLKHMDRFEEDELVNDFINHTAIADSH